MSTDSPRPPRVCSIFNSATLPSRRRYGVTTRPFNSRPCKKAQNTLLIARTWNEVEQRVSVKQERTGTKHSNSLDSLRDAQGQANGKNTTSSSSPTRHYRYKALSIAVHSSMYCFFRQRMFPWSWPCSHTCFDRYGMSAIAT
jgi:hypothetical protein